MKKLIIAILSQLLCFQAFAWRESNGGHGVTAEAVSIATTFMTEIWKVPSLRVLYRPSDFLIIPDYDLYLDGVKVDAYTYKDTDLERTLIFIDIDKWNARTFDQKKLLIAHELTHFMSFRDLDYKYSLLALDKIAKYKTIEKRYPDAEYPLDEELMASLNSCKLNNFIFAFLLVGDVNHIINSKDKTIGQLVEQSTCVNIKNYAPLKNIMDGNTALN